MKHSLSLILFVLFSAVSLSNAQQLYYSVITEIPDSSSNPELSAQASIRKHFQIPIANLILEEGKITYHGKYPVSVFSKMGKGLLAQNIQTNYMIDFDLVLEFKPGKYRYSIQNPILQGPPPSPAAPLLVIRETNTIENHRANLGNSFPTKQLDEMANFILENNNSILSQFSSFISSLHTSILLDIKNSFVIDDDW